MSVADPIRYGKLKHLGLRIAREALVDGEKVRPSYLGKVVDLSRRPRSANSSRQGIERLASHVTK